MEAEAAALRQRLLEAQNKDGGWGYHKGSSWTEPTALALLAFGAQGATGSAYDRGCDWLRRAQNTDNGWPPQPGIPTSTWVTAFGVLALSTEQMNAARYRLAVNWLVDHLAPGDSPAARMVARLQCNQPVARPNGGMPFYPGTAAWIGPTAITGIAFAHVLRQFNLPIISASLDASRRYILSCRCRDGGWNHGGATYLSETANSYPETTGMALLALASNDDQTLLPLGLAESLIVNPESLEGSAWLTMALAKHNRPKPVSSRAFPCRTTRDVSLRLLALNAYASGNRLLCA